MNSEDIDERAAQALDAICDRLRAEKLAQLIDVPVDRALRGFRFVDRGSFSPSHFHQVVGGLVEHVFLAVPKSGQFVDSSVMRSCAVSFIESAYQSVHESGYDGALCDILQPPEPGMEGIDIVLHNLADILKAWWRAQYMDWVYARYIDPLDHELQRAIVRLVLRRHHNVISDDLLNIPVFELADQLRKLLDAVPGALD